MVLAIIQARVASSRLPAKVLLDLCGNKVLWHVVNRVKQSKLLDKVIIATVDNDENTVISDFCLSSGIPCFRGSENDVLDRYYNAAKCFGASASDVIVRITSDCPLIDPVVIDEVIALFYRSDVDYASNVLPPTYPDGLDTEVFKFTALERAWTDAKLSSEREHVTPYIIKHEELFKRVTHKNSVDLSGMRWTLDEPADFEAISAIYNSLYKSGKKIFIMEDIIQLLQSHPEISEINNKYKRNEGYQKSITNDKVVL